MWAEQGGPGEGWAGLGWAGLAPSALSRAVCVEPPEPAQHGGVRTLVGAVGAPTADPRGPSVGLLLSGLG